MNKSDNTFDLVHSLTKSEKRFFRLQSNCTEGDKNYLKVFDVLDAMKVFDGKLLKQKFSGTDLNLSSEKNYLQKLILKNLRNFHSGFSSSSEISDQVRNIDLLFRKRQTALCLKLLTKTKEMAVLYQNYQALLTLIDFEYKLFSRTGDYTKLAAYKDHGLTEKNRVLEMCGLLAKAEALTYEITATIQMKGASLTDTARKRLSALVSETKTLLKIAGDSFFVQELCLINLYYESAYNGDVQGSYKYCKEVILLYNKHPHQIADRPGRYYTSLGNFISRCITLKKYDEALESVDQLTVFLKQMNGMAYSEIGPEAHMLIYNYRLRICAEMENYEEGIPLIKAFEKDEKKGIAPLRENVILTTGIHVARLYFGHGDFKKALPYVNAIINNQNRLPEDFVQYAYMLRLLIQFEVGNLELVENLNLAASRLFKTKWTQNKAGVIITDHFQKFVRAKSKTAITEVGKSMKKRLETIATETGPGFDYDDFIKWAGRK